MIFIENYKGYDISFDNETNKFYSSHEFIGTLSAINCSILKQDIEKYSECRYITPIRAFDLRHEGRYIDIFGFDSENNFVVKYDNGHISRMSSSASDDFFLEESKGIVEEIKLCNGKIDELKNTIQDLSKRIKNISTLV